MWVGQVPVQPSVRKKVQGSWVLCTSCFAHLLRPGFLYPRAASNPGPSASASQVCTTRLGSASVECTVQGMEPSQSWPSPPSSCRECPPPHTTQATSKHLPTPADCLCSLSWVFQTLSQDLPLHSQVVSLTVTSRLQHASLFLPSSFLPSLLRLSCIPRKWPLFAHAS